MQHRPARRHQKIGVVERKNAAISQILAKLAIANPWIDLEMLASRAALISNALSAGQPAATDCTVHSREGMDMSQVSSDFRARYSQIS